MSEREKDVLNFITGFLDKFGYSPTVREITKGVYLSSTFSVHRHIDNLSQKGYLKHTPKTPRSIVILKFA